MHCAGTSFIGVLEYLLHVCVIEFAVAIMKITSSAKTNPAIKYVIKFLVVPIFIY